MRQILVENRRSNNNNNNNNNKFINKIDIRKIYKDKKYRIMIILSLLVAIILANKAICLN